MGSIAQLICSWRNLMKNIWYIESFDFLSWGHWKEFEMLFSLEKSPFVLHLISFLIFCPMWGVSQRLAHSISLLLPSDSYLSVRRKPQGGLSVRCIDTAQVAALGSGEWAWLSEAQKFPKFGRTVITKAILRLSLSLCLSFSHFLPLVSVKSCTISQNSDR